MVSSSLHKRELPSAGQQGPLVELSPADGGSIGKHEVLRESSLPNLVPANLIILQPTPFCNIDCSYCYLAERSSKTRMTLETTEAIVRFLVDVPFAQDSLTVCWHAGEPLAVGSSFYERAFQAFASSPRRVHQNIQTNGTLINDEWCRLFKKWSVRVGVSVDGPKAIHDAHRVDRSGRGTFDRVTRGISKLREHGIPFSVIAVLTRDSLDSAEQLWAFFKSAGITHVGFNIDEAEGIHQPSSLKSRHHLRAFQRFMARIADLSETDPTLRFREVDDMRRHLLAPPGAEVQRADNRPGAILNINANGDLTTFSPELLGSTHPVYGTFAWGNVRTHRWADITRHPGFKRSWEDIQAGVELCRKSCQYFALCGGGCPSNKLTELGTFAGSETQCCRFHVQAVADVMIKHLERQIEPRLRRTADRDEGDYGDRPDKKSSKRN